MEMQVLYNGKFTAVSFGMAGVHMLGNPGLVIELFTTGNTWRWSFNCQCMGTLRCSVPTCVHRNCFVVVSTMSAFAY